MPDVSEVRIDAALTNFSLAFMNEGYVANQVFPSLPVDNISDKYFVYDRGAFLRSSGRDAQGKPRSLRRSGSVAAEIDYSLSSVPYYCDSYARRAFVGDRLKQNAAQPLQPAMDATNVVTESLLIDNEIAVASMACRTTNYGSSNKVTLSAGGSGTSWASYGSSNSNPLLTLNTGKVAVRKGMMREANYALFSIESATTMAEHPQVKELTKYTNKDGLTTSGLPEVVRGLRVIEGASQVQTSPEGQDFAAGSIWQDENATNICLVFYSSTDLGPRSVQFGRTFDAPDETTNQRGVSIIRYRQSERRGEFVEGQMTRDWKFVSLDKNDTSGKPVGGYLISNTTGQ